MIAPPEEGHPTIYMYSVGDVLSNKATLAILLFIIFDH